ncbi:hypothetical protein VTJ83DRAFT_2816 [Remersonia thermophila]|uniref:N-acetylgalactosaminide beta-1,3-galactosyltransferase n=1 Tax=Remersonia thermophila TaxID=72144 RepID=A0ABR4DCE6_9PEZI
MIVTYRNNRVVPIVIITLCLWLVYNLFDLHVNNWVTVWDISKTDDNLERSPPSPPADPAPSRPPPSTSTNDRRPAVDTGLDGLNLTTNDVLLIMKTGTTSMWKRLPIYLTTSLSPDRIPPENVVIYSDSNDQIGSFQIIDVLANITEITKARPDFQVYQQQPEYARHNVYVEAAGVEGDNYGPPGGWIIDKYKFVPLMQHAGRNWPKAKWYIYMEDDTYLFLPSVLRYLSGFDWQEPHYLGHFAGKSDVIFAHGGAGFALSRGAWEKSFGVNENMSDDYEEYTAQHCCGDQVLGHALNKHGVRFGENGGDEKFTWGFNAIIHWRFAFSRWNWCRPLMSWHKVHSLDIARYHAFERSWDFTKPMLYKDFFLGMIAPRLRRRAEWWDNLSSLYSISSGNKDSPPAPESEYDAELWKQAWISADACEVACKGWKSCVQWNYVEDLCSMDDKFMMGQGYAPGMPERKTALMRTSGWLSDRLDNWKCE